MSTRCTIILYKNIHLYFDCHDDCFYYKDQNVDINLTKTLGAEVHELLLEIRDKPMKEVLEKWG